MNIGIVGIGIAITFAIIALSAVTLYLAFRVKETFREDTGFKGQITKIGFILGILFLAGGVFYFGAAAIVKPNMINYTNNSSVPEVAIPYTLKEPTLDNGYPMFVDTTQTPAPTTAPTPTPTPTQRWGDYYAPSSPSSISSPHPEHFRDISRQTARVHQHFPAAVVSDVQAERVADEVGLTRRHLRWQLRYVHWRDERRELPIGLFGEEPRAIGKPASSKSSTVIHFAMSSAFELMPPAGFVLSESNGFTGATLPSSGACGAATFAPATAAECRTLLPSMPTFFRMRPLDVFRRGR